MTVVFLKHEKKKRAGGANRLSNGVSLIVTHLVTKSMIVDAKLTTENHKLENKNKKKHTLSFFNVLPAFEDATAKGCVGK